MTQNVSFGAKFTALNGVKLKHHKEIARGFEQATKSQPGSLHVTKYDPKTNEVAVSWAKRAKAQPDVKPFVRTLPYDVAYVSKYKIGADGESVKRTAKEFNQAKKTNDVKTVVNALVNMFNLKQDVKASLK